MIFLSLISVPLGIFDYLSQPSYWHPPTFFSLPVGIEGYVLGFCIGGIGGVIYEERAQKQLRKKKVNRTATIYHLLIPLSVVAVSFGLYLGFRLNMMQSLPLALMLGAILITVFRRDLTRPVLFSGLMFGTFYFIVLFIWLLFFPAARTWWNLAIYGNLTVLGVPLGEVIFGFVYGAFWGPVYEFVFGYRLARNRVITR